MSNSAFCADCAVPILQPPYPYQQPTNAGDGSTGSQRAQPQPEPPQPAEEREPYPDRLPRTGWSAVHNEPATFAQPAERADTAGDVDGPPMSTSDDAGRRVAEIRERVVCCEKSHEDQQYPFCDNFGCMSMRVLLDRLDALEAALREVREEVRWRFEEIIEHAGAGDVKASTLAVVARDDINRLTDRINAALDEEGAKA